MLKNRNFPTVSLKLKSSSVERHCVNYSCDEPSSSFTDHHLTPQRISRSRELTDSIVEYRKHSLELSVSTRRRTSSLFPAHWAYSRDFSQPACENSHAKHSHATTMTTTTRTSPFYVRAVRRSRETRGHWLRENLPPPLDECADRQCGVVGGLRGVARKGCLVSDRER